MNRRSNSTGIDRKQIREVMGAWHHALRIGLPLNAFITIAPAWPGAFHEAKAADFAKDLRNKMRAYDRSRGITLAYAWSREVDKADPTSEHLHFLKHVPSKHRDHFEQTVRGWFPGEPNAVLIKRAHYGSRTMCGGKRGSAAGYLVKQATPQAVWGTTVSRRAGGLIFGKRSGVSSNLSAKAIAAWRDRDRDASAVERLIKIEAEEGMSACRETPQKTFSHPYPGFPLFIGVQKVVPICPDGRTSTHA